MQGWLTGSSSPQQPKLPPTRASGVLAPLRQGALRIGAEQSNHDQQQQRHRDVELRRKRAEPSAD
jgi:hypothetical protein